MNLEGITINILTSRLQEKLLGGKIYKVFMPNKSSLLLLVKTDRYTFSFRFFRCFALFIYAG